MLSILADENMPLVDELFADFAWIERKAGRDISTKDLMDTDILLVRSITQVNQALLENTPVKFVGSATIGTDHIDQQYLAANDIQFAYAPGCNAQAVAEYVLTAIAYWAHKHKYDLHTISIGIIGAGNVGTRLSQLLEHLGIRYLFNDPPLEANAAPGDFVDIEAIQQCEVVTCHVPLNHGGDYPTYHLLDETFLSKMKKGSLLINTARGAVLDNQAALKVLNQDKAIDFVLDVWEGEPEPNVELLEKTLIATPHIAGYSLEGKIRGTYMLYQQIRQWLSKEALIKLESKLPHSLSWQKPRYLADLHDSLVPFYDIQEDDTALKAVANKDNLQLATDFDALRKNYKNRLEYWR